MQDQSQNTTSKAENLVKPTAENPIKQGSGKADESYPNKLNDADGKGSPYGGTQSGVAGTPDGLQSLKGAATEGTDAPLPEGLGDEYGSQDSYGEEGSDKPGDQIGDTDARGSGVR